MTPLIVLQDCCTIQLTKGRKSTLVDADVYCRVSHLTWSEHIAKRIYSYAVHFAWDRSRHPRKLVKTKLHRLIMDAPDGLMVDHENGDTLDNRRENLRLATHAQNNRNVVYKKVGAASKYKGVKYHKLQGNWFARIGLNGRSISLGYYETDKEAAEAYDLAAIKYHGEFARTNRQVYPDEFD